MFRTIADYPITPWNLFPGERGRERVLAVMGREGLPMRHEGMLTVAMVERADTLLAARSAQSGLPCSMFTTAAPQ